MSTTLTQKPKATKPKTEAKSAIPKSTVTRIKKLAKAGKSQQEIAEALNKSKLVTPRGKPWTQQNVWRILHRVK